MAESLKIESASVSDRGLSEKRPLNEDSFLEIPQSGIFAVADGVGGAEAGEVASQMAVEILGEAFVNVTDKMDAELVMRTALERANAAIHQMSSELPQLAKMATTVVALHISGDIATIGHAGDSRLYRLDRHKQLHRETQDHSMVAEEVRAGRMTEEQAENHPGKNIISRALGAEATVEVDLKTMMVEPDTTFMICSDGVTRHIPDAEIAALLGSGAEPSAICGRIKELCYERGAQDNLTAVLVRLSAKEGSTNNVSDEPHEAEEITVATARTLPTIDTAANTPDADDDLLEIGSAPPQERVTISDEPDVFLISEPPPAAVHHAAPAEPAPAAAATTTQDDEEEFLTAPAMNVADQIPAAPAAAPTATPVAETPMFGGSTSTASHEDRPGSTMRFVSAIGLLLIGGILGLAAYYFLLAPRSAETTTPQLSQMKSDNIAFTAFEKNRRNVDADPVGYLKETPPPNDAEDFYLAGRAYILTGDLPMAHGQLLEAQKRLATTDPANAKVLASDVAIALVITDDPTSAAAIKKELATESASAANKNANR